MSRVITILSVLVLSFALMSGCSSQEAQQKEAGAAGHPEEVADSTRLDSGVSDTAVIESTEPAVDTGTGEQ